jgi:ABC-type lipoprotein release transport system permease subunit
MSVRFNSGAAAVRTAVRDLDPQILAVARQAQDWIEQVTEDLWSVAGLIAVLGLISVLLAATGIYGTVSFSVARRTKEWAIRAGLGARQQDIFRELMTRGGRPVLEGLLAGLWLSAGVTAGLRQAISGSPLRLETGNPAIYGGVALILVLGAVGAMAAPARRGALAKPLDSLRSE